MKATVILFLVCLLAFACTNDKEPQYSKAIIYSIDTTGETISKEVPGPFIVSNDNESKFTRVFNSDNSIGVEYFADQVEDNKVPVLNTQTGNNSKMMWRKSKGHVIETIESTHKDTLGFSFYDGNVEKPVKSVFMFIK